MVDIKTSVLLHVMFCMKSPSDMNSGLNWTSTTKYVINIPMIWNWDITPWLGLFKRIFRIHEKIFVKVKQMNKKSIDLKHIWGSIYLSGATGPIIYDKCLVALDI